MKRTPLLRRVGLKSSGGGLRRSWLRPKPRDEDDKVTPAMHAAILARDKECVQHKLDPTHICRDRNGYPHSPDKLALLTLDHVHDMATMGKRAPSDRAHLVALCFGSHITSGWATSHRPDLRRYIRQVEHV